MGAGTCGVCQVSAWQVHCVCTVCTVCSVCGQGSCLVAVGSRRAAAASAGQGRVLSAPVGFAVNVHDGVRASQQAACLSMSWADHSVDTLGADHSAILCASGMAAMGSVCPGTMCDPACHMHEAVVFMSVCKYWL